MPSYLFDFHDGTALRPDDLGLELDGRRAARVEAVRALLDVARDILSDGKDRSIAARVRDEHGRPVLTATLALAVEVHG